MVEGLFWGLIFCRSFQCLSLLPENCAQSVVSALQAGGAGPVRTLPALCLGWNVCFGTAEERRMAPHQPAPFLQCLDPREPRKLGFGAAWLLWRDRGGQRGTAASFHSLLPLGMAELVCDLAHLQETPELP